MLQAARGVTELITGLDYDQYLADRRTQLAVERQIEIVGEAARNVSEEFCDRHHEIPWVKIIAQRHVLAHEYGDIQQERIWRVATTHIPELISQLEPLVPDPPPAQ
jgi:uncharacterized protein with HEPN domain